MSLQALPSLSGMIKKNGKIVFPGVVIILLIIIYMVIRAGVAYHAKLMEEIGNNSERYKVSSGILSKGGKVLGELESVEAQIKRLEAGMIRAKKAPVGAARLQSELKALADRRDITVASSKVLPVREMGLYTRIPVEFHFKSKIAPLKDLLYDIQRSTSLIAVKGIRIKVDARRRDSKADQLEVVLRVEGLMKRQ